MMMRGSGHVSLLRKELRALMPFGVLLVFFYCILNYVDRAIRGPLDVVSLWTVIGSGPGNGSDSAWLTFILAFGLGLALGAGEHDQGTIAFLDTLPTTRSAVFRAKVIAGAAILALIPLSALAYEVPMALWNRTSVDDRSYAGFIVTTALLVYVLAIVAFAYGLALAPARRMAWAFLALVIVLELQLERIWPAAEAIKPSTLMRLQLHGVDVVVPWRAVAAQLCAGAAALAVGWLAFAVGADRAAAAFRSLNESRRGRAIVVVITLLVVTSWGFLFWALRGDSSDAPATSRRTDAEPLAGVTFRSPSPLRLATAAYDFDLRYTPDDAGRAQLLASDGSFEQVKRTFAFEAPTAPRIAVDATGQLGIAMHLGQTSWDTVSMDARVVGRDDFPMVIVHETAHVFANVTSDRRMSDKHNATHVFNEGLATVVAEDITGAPPQHRLAVAFARSRDLVESSMLFNEAELRARLDPNTMVYGLGRELVRATIDVGKEGMGARTAAEVVAALAESPKDLDGITLWRDAYQRRGLNLDDVLARWSQRLDEAVREQQAVLDTIPRSFAAVELDGNRVLVTVSVDGAPPAGAAPVCQARPSQDHAPEHLVFTFADETADGPRCTIARARLPRPQADVQVGWSFDDTVVFEAWTTVDLR